MAKTCSNREEKFILHSNSSYSCVLHIDKKIKEDNMESAKPAAVEYGMTKRIRHIHDVAGP